MGKISPIAAKYIINAEIEVNGIVEKPDAVGAVFGQTEGLLGPDLELRELQRSGRIGRIEVTLKSRSGKSIGSIMVPSSLDKSETAIIAAALETVDRIGPCTSKIAVGRIEDVRMAKRKYIVDRAKELLAQMMSDILPDSQEISDEVKQAVRVEELVDYGPERLPSGPNLLTSDEIIIVEGRADVINLLRQGIKNALAVEGTNIPPSVIGLTKEKTATVFVDGDHGGELIIKELLHSGAEIDFITMAPAGKEVEELTKKEVHKCLRSRTPGEQYDASIENDDANSKGHKKPKPKLPEKKEKEEEKPEKESVKEEEVEEEEKGKPKEEIKEEPEEEVKEEPIEELKEEKPEEEIKVEEEPVEEIKESKKITPEIKKEIKKLEEEQKEEEKLEEEIIKEEKELAQEEEKLEEKPEEKEEIEKTIEEEAEKIDEEKKELEEERKEAKEAPPEEEPKKKAKTEKKEEKSDAKPKAEDKKEN